MPSSFSRKLRNRIETWNLPLIIQVWIFFLVVLFFQLIWENFEVDIDAFPPFVYLSRHIGEILLNTTPSLIHLFSSGEIVRDGISLVLPNGYYVNYFFYLSGIKQICLAIVLFLIVPGPFQKKLWYIPLTVMILFVTVFLRFWTITLHALVQPEYIQLLKNLLLGPWFYFEIVVLWMAWVLMVAKTARLRKNPGNPATG